MIFRLFVMGRREGREVDHDIEGVFSDREKRSSLYLCCWAGTVVEPP